MNEIGQQIIGREGNMKRYRKSNNPDNSGDDENKEKFDELFNELSEISKEIDKLNDGLEDHDDIVEDDEEEEEEMDGFDGLSVDLTIEADSIIKDIEDYPLCSFFMEIRKNAPEKSTLSWLSICDRDTVNMIIEISDELRKDEPETKKAEDNKSEDVFENPKLAEEETPTEVTDASDFCGLAVLLYCWENSVLRIPITELEDIYNCLSFYANAEALRRDKLLTIKGSGLLLDDATKCVFTKKGEKFSKKLLKKLGIDKKIKDMEK
jgi:hypothetical protein